MTAITIGESTATVDGMTAAEAAVLADQGDRPAHLARCRECPFQATYRPTASGFGFTVVKHSHADQEITLGVSASGLPMCPEGHGEMLIADDQIPAEDAIQQAADTLAGATAARLPFPVAFNAAGALESIFAKNHDFQELERRHADLKDRTKRAKDDLDECAKALKDLIATVTEQLAEDRQREIDRRQAILDRGEDPDAEVIVCRFLLLHPGIPCPFDHAGLTAEHLTSEAHGAEAQALLVEQEIATCVVELAGMGVHVAAEQIAALPIDQLSELQAWSKDGAQNPERVAELLDALPKGLGRPHVFGDVGKNSDQSVTYQECSACGGSFVVEAPYPVGALVSTDCQGKALKDGHRYPKRKKGAKGG